MQLKEKKSSMERDKRKLESELEKQRQKIGKQVFLQVVQKKPQQQQNENLTVLTSTQSPQTVMEQQLLADRSQLLLSNSPNKSVSLLKETPRRQWDKTQKGFIDLESDSNSRKSMILNNANGVGAGASSTSSMSTPSSSASQSPPLSNGRNINNNENDSSSSSNSSTSSKSSEQKAHDLSKVYYSRDEMVKTIEALKVSVNAMSNSKVNSPTTAFNVINSSSVKDINSELQLANSKLYDLQNEINRLTLMQQKQTSNQTQKYLNNNKLINGGSSNINHSNGFTLNEEKKEINVNEQKIAVNNGKHSEDENQQIGKKRLILNII